MEELFNLPGWKWIEDILSRVHLNADAVLHSANSVNRELYAGKCLAVREIRDAFEVVKDEIDSKKNEKNYS